MKTQSLKSHAQPISRSSLNYLLDHILGGYKSSHEGIIQLKQLGMVTDQELVDLLTKNGERLINRIVEFKLLQRLSCIFFAALFGYMQLTCEDLEMRKARNLRMRRRHNVEVVK